MKQFFLSVRTVRFSVSTIMLTLLATANAFANPASTLSIVAGAPKGSTARSTMSSANTPSTRTLANELVSSAREQVSSSPLPSHPNIIFILTDDLDYNSFARFPRLKSLMTDQGSEFNNFFVSFSLCCPSRSSILRGQYIHNHQVVSNKKPDGGFVKFHSLGHENSTIATWLQAAGYRTVLIGKYLNDYPGGAVAPSYVPPGWNEWYSPVAGKPYSEFDYSLNENGKIVRYGTTPQDYMVDVLSHKATDYIQRTNTAQRPFFLYIAPYVPHAPATPAPRYLNSFPNAKAPRSPSFNEADVSDKPAWIRHKLRLNSSEISGIDQRYRRRLQSMEAVGDLVSNLIQTLKATNQLDNTYIFLTSDNGFNLGEHRIPFGKSSAYEEDIHVPLVVRGPGVPAGRVVKEMGLNIDFAPTFAQLAGVAAPSFVDGRSLVPFLSNNPPPSDWRQAILLERLTDNANTKAVNPPKYEALRTNRYKYVEYVNGERELYDLQTDPHELNNLAGTADSKLIKQLSLQLATLKSCAGASCRASQMGAVQQNNGSSDVKEFSGSRSPRRVLP